MFLTALLTMGCSTTLVLFPLSTPENVVFDPLLLGSWQFRRSETGEPPSGETGGIEQAILTFTEREDQGYDLTIDWPEHGTAAFKAYVVQLGIHRFLDLYPDLGESLNPFLAIHVVSAHSVWKLSWRNDGVHAVALDARWLGSQVDDRVPAGSSVKDDSGTFLLTTMTKDLQAFVSEHADDPETFPEEGSGSVVLELQRAVVTR